MPWGLAFLALLYIGMLVILLSGCSQPTHNEHYLDMAMLGESSELTLETRVMK